LVVDVAWLVVGGAVGALVVLVWVVVEAVILWRNRRG
jgi:hypothetical protein